MEAMVKPISPKELKKALLENASPRIVLVDVRDRDEFGISSLPGAQLIPMVELVQRAPLELKKEDHIVLFCAHGVRSDHGARVLFFLGYPKVSSLTGGLALWPYD
jgi:rhodanese-related sulfurtransferase